MSEAEVCDIINTVLWRAKISPGFIAFVVLTSAGASLLFVAKTFSPSEPKRVYAIAFSPDSDLLAAGTTDGELHVWRTQDWATIAVAGEVGSRLNSLAFAPDSETLAAAGDGLAFWDPHTLTRHVLPGTRGRIYGTVKYSADGKRVATVSSREQIEIWDILSERRVQQFCCSALCGDVAFRPKGRLLASSGHLLRLWDLGTGREVARLQDDEYVVGQIAFSPDGEVLAAGSQDRRLRLWDVATHQVLCVLPGHEAYVESVAFSPDSTLVASGGRGNLVRLWGFPSANPIDIPPHRSTGDIRFSPDGVWLAAAAEGSIWLWNLILKYEQTIPFD